MTSVEYELLRKRASHLGLPAWRELKPTDRHKVKRLSPSEVTARRAAVLLKRQPGVRDRKRWMWSRRHFDRGPSKFVTAPI